MAKSNAERVRDYRARRKAEGASDTSRNWKHMHKRNERERLDAKVKPFVGCDGEGAGTDAQGRQNYLLFRMGDRELYRGGERLSTEELLDFICDQSGDSILVGFAFGYDVTMILRDLPPKQQERLFQPREYGEGKSRYVWYRGFDIEYLPKQYFRVRRARSTRGEDGREKRIPVKGSSRTIFETFGFFQMSFLKAITAFEVGTEKEREQIAVNKARRGDFITIDDEERDYCAMECRFLADLMEKLREYCYAADIRPKSWNGAGKLAGALHRLHKTIGSESVRELVPKGALEFGNMAYYGGRFEITRTGMINGDVHEYDIRSAYPDAMRFLPCLVHGQWRQADAGDLSSCTGLFVASCTFAHADHGHAQLCGLPVRSKDGYIYWPQRGGGVYWSVEIEAAKKLGCKVRYREGWIYEKHCDCKPFSWVEPLYDYRQSIGSKGPGYPIKLGINALYGMLAQRIGNGKYANLIYAGLITAYTRSKIMDAASLSPSSICMIATDGIYSTVPLDLEEGVRLGQWEHERLEGLFIVQPGLYWSPSKRKRKSRGLPGKFFEEEGRTEAFESAWRSWNGDIEHFPSSRVLLTSFIGLKLALSRGKPESAGCWVEDHRDISFDYTNKRDGFVWGDGHIVTAPKAGRPGLLSLPHREFLKTGGHEPWEKARLMLEEMPDYVDLSAPFQD